MQLVSANANQTWSKKTTHSLEFVQTSDSSDWPRLGWELYSRIIKIVPVFPPYASALGHCNGLPIERIQNKDFDFIAPANKGYYVCNKLVVFFKF